LVAVLVWLAGWPVGLAGWVGWLEWNGIGIGIGWFSWLVGLVAGSIII